MIQRIYRSFMLRVFGVKPKPQQPLRAGSTKTTPYDFVWTGSEAIRPTEFDVKIKFPRRNRIRRE